MPVRITVKRRNEQNAFRDIWAKEVDPRGPGATPKRASAKAWTIFENGPAARKVDLLLISEGYTARQMPKFHADAARLVNDLFTHEPFRSRKADFNVRGLDIPSAESGIFMP